MMKEREMDPMDDLDLSGILGLENLPPREREQMRRLRDWLLRKDWTRKEALAVLSGYVPSGDGPTEIGLRSHLPGLEAYCNCDGATRDDAYWWNLEAGVDGLAMQFARYLPEGTRPPAEVLRIVCKHNLSPPWLKYALTDPVCRERLPVEVLRAANRDEGAGDPGSMPMTLAEFRSRGGRASKDNNAIRKTFFPIVERLWREGNNVAASIDVKIKGGETEVETFAETPDAKTIANWLNELRAAYPDIAATMTKSKGGRPRK